MKLRNVLKNREKNRLNDTEIVIKCPKCNKNWTTTIGEICWYHEVGNIVPVSCKECRHTRKTEMRAKKTKDETAPLQTETENN